MMPRMSRPENFGESIYLRVPRGTRDAINELRGTERQADFLRRIVLEALEDERRRRGGNHVAGAGPSRAKGGSDA